MASFGPIEHNSGPKGQYLTCAKRRLNLAEGLILFLFTTEGLRVKLNPILLKDQDQEIFLLS